MTMDPDSVIEGFDVFENQFVGMTIIGNLKPIQPFPLDQGMEGFDAGVIVRVAFMAVAELELFRGFTVSFGNVLAAAVRMQK